MLKKPNCEHCNTLNASSRLNILEDDSENITEPLQHEASEKNILSLKNYETDKTSKRNFYLVVNDIHENQLKEVIKTPDDKLVVNTSSTVIRMPDSDNLDTVRSGESLFKNFNFDTSKYNGDTDKCVAFWRTLMKTNLKPVDCTLVKGDYDSTVEEEEEESEYDSCMWYKALVEMQRRKMDEVALAATCQPCKLCSQEEPYSSFKKRQGQRYSENELRDDEDIICLNYWNPKGPTLVNRSTGVQHSESLELSSCTMTDGLEQPPPSREGEQDAEEDSLLDISYNSCKCRRERCRCNGTLTYEEIETVNIPHFTIQELESQYQSHVTVDWDNILSCDEEEIEDSASQSQNESKTLEKISLKPASRKCVCGEADCECDKTEEKSLPANTTRGILQKCDICNTYCKCWEHKIELSKRFIDESRYQLKMSQIKQDKSCETETEVEGKIEEIQEAKSYCIICGHNDCNCSNTQQKTHRQFDNDLVKTLFAKTKKSLSVVKSLTEAKKSSKLIIQQKNYAQSKSKEDICFTDQGDKSVLTTKPEEIKDTYRQCNTAKLQEKFQWDKKKILITPEQRAKEIIHKNMINLQPDKYGIPQVVRYADGRLGPKPATSRDILSDSSGGSNE